MLLNLKAFGKKNVTDVTDERGDRPCVKSSVKPTIYHLYQKSKKVGTNALFSTFDAGRG